MSQDTRVEMDLTALNKFSRQNAAFGAETTAKLIKMKVIIFGLRGIGAETAKNLALQGAGSITLVDSSRVEMRDLGVNFFFSESDISAGLSRAATFAPKLRELNPMCDVKIADELTPELVKFHNALVICNSSVTKSDLLRFNTICRDVGTSFLYAFSGGLNSSVFVDHGDSHIVNDPNGEKPIQKLVSAITQTDTPSEFLIKYSTPEGQIDQNLDDGVYKVTDLSGCEHFNGQLITVSHPYTDPAKTVRVTLPPGSGLEGYSGGGLLTEEKVPKSYPMFSLEYKMKNPGSPFTNDMVMSDLLNFSEQQVHVSFVATLAFAEKYSRFPSAADSTEVFEIAKALITSGDILIEDFQVDEAICSKVSSYSAFELQPMSAFIGGVLAQEVVKCTGKFTPIPVSNFL